MTYKQALESMRKAIELGEDDPEAAHSLGDEILVNFLREEGYYELTNLYEQLTRWTA